KKHYQSPNGKGKPKIKDNRGALTAVRQVRILHRELKKCRKLPCLPVNAPPLGVRRVFRRDFDLRTSLQYLSDPPDQQDSRQLSPNLSPSLRKCHFELTGRGGPVLRLPFTSKL